MKFVEVSLCSLEVQWAWYRFSGACIKKVFAKLQAFVAKLPEVRRVWLFFWIVLDLVLGSLVLVVGLARLEGIFFS